MKPKDQNSGVWEVLWRWPVLGTGLLKYVSAAVSTHTTVEE
jgi:hypothetical protein